MSFELHLLRHGAPVRAGLLLGRTDEPPTAQGIATCLTRTAALDIEHIVASDLARSSEAGMAIGEARGLSYTIDARWRELDFGAWDGQAARDVDQGALGLFWGDPERNPPPGGERWSELIARIGEGIGTLAPQPTLIVTHGGPMRAALHLLCGIDRAALWAFDLPYAALLSLRIHPGERPTAQITGLAT